MPAPMPTHLTPQCSTPVSHDQGIHDDGGALCASEAVLCGDSSRHALHCDRGSRSALGQELSDAPPRHEPAVLRREARGADRRDEDQPGERVRGQR